MSAKVNLIFTRDFSLMTSDVWHAFLTTEVHRELGAPIVQLAHFTGRAVEYYRVRSEVEELKHQLLAKGPAAPALSAATIRTFQKNVTQLRALFSKARPDDADRVLHLFRKGYSCYFLSIYIPGVWSEDIRRAFGEEGERVVARWYQCRLSCEGALKELDTYLRSVATQLLPSNLRAYAHCLRFTELEALLNKKPAPSLSTLRQRSHGYVLFENMLTFQSLRKFLRAKGFVREDHAPRRSTTHELHGTVASKGGMISGIARVILNAGELARAHEGCVFVTSMTAPEYLPFLRKAAAIVTDEGSVICHAAIVSRELGIPCITGTKYATTLLEDGDHVTVDAQKGMITW